MLLLLHGEDTFRLNLKAKNIEKGAIDKHGSFLGVEKILAAELSFADFWNLSAQKSIFQEKKLFFIKGIAENELFKKFFLQKAQEMAVRDDIFVVLEQQALKSNDLLLKKITLLGKTQKFDTLDVPQISKWAKTRFAEYSCSIEKNALEYLVCLAGGNLFFLDNEIKKLACFKKNIELKDIVKVCSGNSEAEIFSTLHLLIGGNRNQAVSAIERHIAKGDSPFYLFSMLAYQCRNLILAKLGAGQSAANLGLHSFVLRKLQLVAKGMELAEIKNAYGFVASLDYKIKTGQIKPVEALLSFASMD